MHAPNLPLYHAAPNLLAPGSIILPGNFWRVMRTSYSAQTMDIEAVYRVSREVLFDLVRATKYPELPSRMHSCFAFVGEEAARAGLPQLGPAMVLYEAELFEPDAPCHRADFGLVGYAKTGPWVEGTTQLAEKYWSGKIASPVVELVTASPLRLGKMVHQSLPAD